MDDNQPSTSSSHQDCSTSAQNGETTEEISSICQSLDQTLQNKANDLNLTSVNVKSILHHLIKFPSTLDVLMGIEGGNDLPNVRLTRSQRKNQVDSNDNKMSILFESLAQPRTFLDIDFDDNDEFDNDYEEELDFDEEDLEEIEETCEEDETTSIEDNKSTENELLNESFIYNNTPSPMIDLNESSDRINTDNPDYRNFLKSVIEENSKQSEEVATEDDLEDEDYDVQRDDDLSLDVDQYYENRNDRATEIPRYEVEHLVLDTILAEKEIPANVLPKKVIAKTSFPRNNIKEKDEVISQRLRSFSNFGSASLLQPNVQFRNCEIDQLKLQLEQHVQLLTQTVVLCYPDDSLMQYRNEAQKMINELDESYQKHGDQSIFNIENLAGSIVSCHDIINIKKIKLTSRWAENLDCVQGLAPKPESIAVMARSTAIKFPALLPKVQLKRDVDPINFTSHEDFMLMLALLQYSHLPRRSDLPSVLDRYTAIHLNCLPSRSSLKIRNHLKTMRRSDAKSHIHYFLSSAEQGTCCFVYVPPTVAKFDIPITQWAPEFQPNWLKYFFREYMVTENLVIRKRPEIKLEINQEETHDEPDDIDKDITLTADMVNNIDDENTMSFVIPPTPCGDSSVFMPECDAGQLSTCLIPQCSVLKTPRGDIDESERICWYDPNPEENSNDGPMSADYSPMRKRRKRSRSEKEKMGRVGMNDENYRQLQMTTLSRHIVKDVKKRLFMHAQKWEQLLDFTTKLNSEENMDQFFDKFESLKPIRALMSMYAPLELLSDRVLKNSTRYSYQEAIKMMMNIDSYINGTKMKTPTLRQLYKLILKMVEVNSSSMKAAERFHQLIGHERPLWEVLEPNFFDLAFRQRSCGEEFECIDITNRIKDENYEVIEDFEMVSRVKNERSKSNFMVKSRQLYANKMGAFVPVEVVKSKWTKEYDMELIVKFNQFKDVQKVAQVFENRLPFSKSDIVKRLQYLLKLLT